MSGYYMTFLVYSEENTYQGAIKSAKDEIDAMYAEGSLGPDDHGYIDPIEKIIPATKTEPFRNAISELNLKRATAYQYYVEKAVEITNKAGHTLANLPLEEQEPSKYNDMFGHYMKLAGLIHGRDFTVQGILYDTETFECGITQDRLNELLKHPNGFYLVPMVVG